MDRLNAALSLYRAGKVTQILVSGGQRPPDYDEVRTMQSWLIERQVKHQDILLDRGGVRTLKTMQRAAEIFHIHEAIICTQDYHLPRSIYLARAAGVSAVGLISDHHRYPKILYFKARESLARVKAWIEVSVLHTLR